MSFFKSSRFVPAVNRTKYKIRLLQILGPRIALQFLRYSQETHLAFRADGEDWPIVAEHARHVAVPMSNASIATSCERGLSSFDTFVCAHGTIVVDRKADIVTVYAPKPNNGGRITRVTIGKLTDEKTHSWLNIDDEFATDDPCTLEKTAASYFPHILFLAASPSAKGLKFIIETGKGIRATLTQQELSDFMKIWSRWDGRFNTEDEVWEKFGERGVLTGVDNRSSMDTLWGGVGRGEKGKWEKESLLDEEEELKTSDGTLAEDGEEDRSMWWDGEGMLDDEENLFIRPIKILVTQIVEYSYDG